MVYITKSYDDDYYEEFYHKKDNCNKHDDDEKDCRKKHDNDERDCRKKDDRKDHDKKEEKKAQCFVETHKIGETGNFLNVNIPAGSVPTPIFQDFTKNHNKTFISVTNNGNDVTITINTRGKKCCDRPIMEPIPVNQTRIFQVEDFKSLVATSAGGANLNLVIQKTFCICCKDEKDKKHDKHDCCCDCD